MLARDRREFPHMADFESSTKNEAGAEPQTIGDALRERKKTPKDFAAACGISVARVRRLLKGGFIPNSLDLDAIAQLLSYDSRFVIALRERHNQRYHQRKDLGTVWSVPLEDGTAKAKLPTFDAVGAASDIARDAEAHDYRPPDYSVEPCDVQEAKFRWVYLGCADSMTITGLARDLRWLNKSIASDLAAALEDVELQYAELEANLQRKQMERARAVFAEDPST
jgi:transcriptional regulator with XRE-family HTH domain